MDTSGGTNYKCTAVYTCDTGYVLNGNITRTCQEDTNWSGSEPTCDGKCFNEIVKDDRCLYMGFVHAPGNSIIWNISNVTNFVILSHRHIVQ